MSGNAGSDRLGRLQAAVDGRPMLFAIAAFNGITGLFAAVILVRLSFGGDVDIYRRGAEGVSQGVIAQDFLYAPLFGLLATPLTWVPFTVAAGVMTVIGLAILLTGVRLDTRGLAGVDRGLITIAALGFIPVVYELVLGQVTMLMAASIYPVRDRDGWARGIPLGIVLALVPKPLLLPLLVWMLVRRRRALGAAVLTALAVTLLGVLLMGPDIYRAWIDALVGTGQITRQGNLALDALGSPPLVLALTALTVAAAGWAILRDDRRGFVAALLAGLLATPFTLMYAVSILLLAVRPAVAVAPRATRILALLSNPAVLTAFMAWAAAGLVVVLPWRGRRDGS